MSDTRSYVALARQTMPAQVGTPRTAKGSDLSLDDFVPAASEAIDIRTRPSATSAGSPRSRKS